ncbi:hypothetical protein CDAR_276371 [Caerostris darwini]|uniref:Uncharacterized protein n=1 Tax=Caerostris darwini TaxID=1538125 RepID=A0AAV4N151_9ARAC|nr:hypothetical protein CDAR_276371 [Caerostris darwini]
MDCSKRELVSRYRIHFVLKPRNPNWASQHYWSPQLCQTLSFPCLPSTLVVTPFCSSSSLSPHLFQSQLSGILSLHPIEKIFRHLDDVTHQRPIRASLAPPVQKSPGKFEVRM